MAPDAAPSRASSGPSRGTSGGVPGPSRSSRSAPSSAGGTRSRSERHVGFVHCGAAGEGWAADDRVLDVLDARGTLEALFGDIGAVDWSLGEPLGDPFHPGRSARILLGNEPAGVLGELHPRIAESLEIDGRVAVAEIRLDALRSAAARPFRLVEAPRFPPVRRDLAFVVPDHVPAGALQAIVDAAGGRSWTDPRCSTSSEVGRSRKATRAWPSRSSSGRRTARSRTRRSNPHWLPSSTVRARSSGPSSGPEQRDTRRRRSHYTRAPCVTT